MKRKYVVLSRREGVFDNVCNVIRHEYPRSDIVNASSINDAFRLLRGFQGTGIILTDADAVSLIACPPEESDLLDFHPGEESSLRGPESVIAGLKMYIRLHLDEELGLKKLAEVANLSPNYLCILFKKVEGISVGAFIEKQRVERAAYLLATEDSLTGEIGKRVGYKTGSYFCKAFRKHYGMTPKHYRFMERAKAGNRNQRVRPRKPINS